MAMATSSPPAPMANMPMAPAAGVWLFRAQEGFARFPKAFLMNGMTDPITWTAIPEPETLAGAAQKKVIIG